MCCCNNILHIALSAPVPLPHPSSSRYPEYSSAFPKPNPEQFRIHPESTLRANSAVLALLGSNCWRSAWDLEIEAHSVPRAISELCYPPVRLVLVSCLQESPAMEQPELVMKFLTLLGATLIPCMPPRYPARSPREPPSPPPNLGAFLNRRPTIYRRHLHRNSGEYGGPVVGTLANVSHGGSRRIMCTAGSPKFAKLRTRLRQSSHEGARMLLVRPETCLINTSPYPGPLVGTYNTCASYPWSNLPLTFAGVVLLPSKHHLKAPV